MAEGEQDISVHVNSREDDVLIVSFASGDGSIFRGALLKMKPWSCPNIRPPSPITEELESAMTGDEEAGKASSQCVGSSPPPPVDSLNGVSAWTSQSINPPPAPPLLRDTLDARLSDFAALQHRWSYFEKNAVALPKRNLPSRKEKEKLEQVTKLRPRNFLCTRCKYALPGFPQPVSMASGALPDMEETAASGMTEHSAHTRKRRLPLKRTLMRPLMESLMESSTPLQDLHPTEKLHFNLPQKRRASARRPKLEVDMPAGESATILSAPSVDGGLKMKFKLSNSQSALATASPAKSTGKGIKRSLELLLPASSAPPDRDQEEDDFDLQPRLRIDDDQADASKEELPSSRTDVSAERSPPSLLLQPSTETALPLGSLPRVRRKNARRSPQPSPSAGIVVASSLSSVKVEERKGLAESWGGLPKPVARAVQRCATKDGRHFAVGDIVWGKIVGYPWWPGAIKHIVVCDDPMLEKSAASPAFAQPGQPPILQYQEAQVEWFGQKASISYIEVCHLTHFAQDYEKKYKAKMKTASYQEAVKLALQAQPSLTGQDEDSSLGQDEEDEEDVLSQMISQSRQRQKNLQAGDSHVYQLANGEESRHKSSQPSLLTLPL